MRSEDPRWTPVVMRNVNGSVNGWRYIDNSDDSPVIEVDGRRLYQHAWERMYDYVVDDS